MQGLGCGDKPKGFLNKIYNFKQSFVAFIVFSFSLSTLAGEVITFPRKSRSVCQRYLATPASLESFRPKRTAEVIELDTRKTEYVSKDFFFKTYSTTTSVIFGYYPKGVADFHPLLTSSNFNLWRPIAMDFIINSKQDSIVLMGFQPHNGTSFFNKNRKLTKVESEYQKVTQSHYPAHHTTYAIPKLIRLMLATLEYATAANSYIQNENLSLKTNKVIDYRLIFHNKNPGYAARDFISSWFPQNGYERNLQEFMIRFIDEHVTKSDSFIYEREYKVYVLKELRTIFKNSPEVMNSLDTLEKEFNDILNLSTL